jgi:hypothetical protein
MKYLLNSPSIKSIFTIISDDADLEDDIKIRLHQPPVRFLNNESLVQGKENMELRKSMSFNLK